MAVLLQCYFGVYSTPNGFYKVEPLRQLQNGLTQFPLV